MIDTKFYVNVADLMPKELARPTARKLMEDGVEIPIISITCEGIEW